MQTYKMLKISYVQYPILYFIKTNNFFAYPCLLYIFPSIKHKPQLQQPCEKSNNDQWQISAINHLEFLLVFTVQGILRLCFQFSCTVALVTESKNNIYHCCVVILPRTGANNRTVDINGVNMNVRKA